VTPMEEQDIAAAPGERKLSGGLKR